MRVPIIAGILLATTGCGLGSQTPPADLPPWRMTRDSNGVEVRLIDKPPYSYLYAIDGTLRELRVDSNGDKIPDVFAYFSGRSTPDRLELDVNGDGKLDRWEEYDSDGRLIRFATASKGGSPDRFVEIDPVTQKTLRIETDDDHDGRRERVEFFVDGRLSRAEIDTDGDGRRDRTQTWSDGRLLSEEIDTDNDGRADIRITRTKAGAIAGVERLGR